MRTRTVLLVTVLVLPGLYRPTAAAPQASRVETVQPNALWEPPTGLHDRDLYNGPWGASLQPDPNAVYTFMRRKEHGTNPGVIVRDSRGRTWHVKQASHGGHGAEGPVEVVVSRVLSAVGYHQPPVYFLPSFVMTDGKGPHAESGGRFRAKDASLREMGNWSWDDPTVAGSRPYNGLLVILLAFNSWDLKESNNRICDVNQDGRVSRWYMVRDLGGALGDEGRIWTTRNNIDKFERRGFIKGVDGGFVEFAYGGKRPDLVSRRITVQDVVWATGLMASLDDRQWHDAFRAGGYSDDLSDRFIAKIKAKIFQGQQLAANPQGVARSKW